MTSWERVFDWPKRFIEDQKKVEYDERPDRPITVQIIGEIVRKDLRLSIGMIAGNVNTKKEIVR